jgi:hypothetical protein
MANHHYQTLSEKHCRKRTTLFRLTNAHAQTLDEADRTTTDDELDEEGSHATCTPDAGQGTQADPGSRHYPGGGLESRDESVGKFLVASRNYYFCNQSCGTRSGNTHGQTPPTALGTAGRFASCIVTLTSTSLSILPLVFPDYTLLSPPSPWIFTER